MVYQHYWQTNDYREHDIEHDSDCWCQPKVELYRQGFTLVTHRVIESREVYELTGRKMH